MQSCRLPSEQLMEIGRVLNRLSEAFVRASMDTGRQASRRPYGNSFVVIPGGGRVLEHVRALGGIANQVTSACIEPLTEDQGQSLLELACYSREAPSPFQTAILQAGDDKRFDLLTKCRKIAKGPLKEARPKIDKAIQNYKPQKA